MIRLLLRRVLALIPILLVVTFLTFVLISLVPGDPATTLAGGIDANPEDVTRIRAELHLDEPTVQQYFRWLGDAVQLDFGQSLYSRDAVSDLLQRRLPVTLGLTFAALVVALVIAVPLGVLAGVRAGGQSDRLVRTASSVGFAIPNFWLAILLVTVFGVQRSWFPVAGYVAFTDSPGEWLHHITLPALTLGAAMAALIARQLRASLTGVLDSNYVRAVWARGAGPMTAIGRHAMKNGMIPVITTVGVQIGYLLGGTVIVEQIFSIPGLGSAMVDAVTAGDLPIIQGLVVTFVLTQVAIGLLADIAYGFVNPKVRITG